MEVLKNDRSAARAGRDSEFDVVIIGAGFAGLYSIYRLRALGLKLKVYEAASGVGGTWFWNRYPGARCDVESMEYSYSFSDELQQEWNWTERYAGQPEILKYLNHVADRYDLRDDIQFNTRVVSAVFDRDTSQWTITTNQGDEITASFCIMATGNLSLPSVPKFKGLESFAGAWYHTGLWPIEDVDFTGRRVGVIGTGSSGIQAIPLIAQQAEHLYVFQRTPNFSLPANNHPLDPEYVKKIKSNYAAIREKARKSKFGNARYDSPQKSALEDSPEERRRLYEDRWTTGGLNFTRTYKDLLTNKEANETAGEFVRTKIREAVKNDTVADVLAPKDHYIGTKRPCTDTDYYETYNRKNVTLVNVKESSINQIIEHGIQTENAEYALDAIVFATGYDAVTGAILNIDISVKGGTTLAEKWKDGPRAYLGLMASGFPNLFFITGPGSPSVLTNMVCAIEQHVEWLSDCVDHLRKNNFRQIEADPQHEDKWVDHVNDLAANTLYPSAKSWYTGANIPGKPRIFPIYIGGFGVYREKCIEVAAHNYIGFSMIKV